MVLALCFSSFRRGEAAIAASWLAQGERLLEIEPEGREHGRLSAGSGRTGVGAGPSRCCT